MSEKGKNRVILVSFPDRFFPFYFVVSATTNKNGKKQSGNETSVIHVKVLVFKKSR